MKKILELYSTMNRDLDEHNAQTLIKIWNLAIDTAAKIVECSETNLIKIIAEDIRGLKK